MKRLLCAFVIAACAASPLVARQTPPPAAAPTPGVATPAPPIAFAPQTPPPAAPRGGAPSQGRGTTPPAPMPPSPDVAPLVPPAPAAPRAPTMPYPASNVKLELAITDTYAGVPTRKVVTMLVANGSSGQIRTSNRLPDNSPVFLNVDSSVYVWPANTAPGSKTVIRTSLSFQYSPAQMAPAENRPAPRPADLNESVTVLLQDGATTIVSQSADPATDRKVTVEVTATIIK